MVRARTNDPAGLTDEPTCVTDPCRESELAAEFRSRLSYIAWHYLVGKRLFGTVADRNDAARALNALAAGKYGGAGNSKRLPPIIEIAVSRFARDFAQERTDESIAPIGHDVRRAAIHVGSRLRPISNRPRDDNLIHHVGGLMALIQDFSGKPVVPRRNRNSVYAPHFAPGVSQLVPIIFGDLEPSATIGRLVSIAERARKDWAGRRPSFNEYFPGYGMRRRSDGSHISASGVRIVSFEQNIPTYFH